MADLVLGVALGLFVLTLLIDPLTQAGCIISNLSDRTAERRSSLGGILLALVILPPTIVASVLVDADWWTHAWLVTTAVGLVALVLSVAISYALAILNLRLIKHRHAE